MSLSTLRRFAALLFFLCLFANLSAQNNTVINIQGTLKDASGVAVPDGQREVTFKLYNLLSGGTAVWDETATVEVVGGIYSHNLGTVEDLVEGDFASTVYLGITVGSLELSPRTQMTYAPYALSVFAAQRIAQQGCSGQVGDVKYSVLNPTQFAQENGECWVPMDGRAIAGTRMATDYGMANVPDMSGLFIRATEYLDGNDPGRSPMAVATLQGDDNKSHLHGVNINTTTNGNHAHTVNDNHQAFESNGWSDGGDDYALNTNTTRTTSTNGNHTHNVNGNTNASGSAEARPKNMNFFIYMRVD